MACMAIQEPGILHAEDDADEIIAIDGKDEYVKAKVFKDAVDEWYPILVEFGDWYNERFVCSITEYRQLPAVYIEAWNIYKNAIKRENKTDE